MTLPPLNNCISIAAKEQSSEKDEEDLISALRQSLNTEIARNVVIFIGDGMGPNTATAARIYMAGEEGHLVWEKFPHLATLKVSVPVSVLATDLPGRHISNCACCIMW